MNTKLLIQLIVTTAASFVLSACYNGNIASTDNLLQSFEVSYDSKVLQLNMNVDIAPTLPTLRPSDIEFKMSAADAAKLPTGLSFDTSSGRIQGAPTALLSPAYTFPITVTVLGKIFETSITLEVLDIPIDFTFPQNTLTAQIGDSLSVSPVMTGGQASSWIASPISGTVAAWSSIGLTLDSTNGQISGQIDCSLTPGTYNYRVTASNPTTSDTFDLAFVISARTPISLSYTGSPFTGIRGTAISAISPTVTGPAGLNYSITPGLPTGLSLNTATGEVTGTPTVVSSPGVSYTVTASEGICSNTQNTSFTIEVEEKPIVIALSPTSYNFVWGNPITAIAPTVNPTGSSATSWEISAVSPAVAIGTDTGLSFATLTGQISGTPSSTNAGSTFSYDILARNSYGMASNTIRVSITVDARTAPAFHYSGTAFSLHRGVTAITNTVTQDAGGTIASFSISPSLPSGLSFSTSTGAVSGTPDAATLEDVSGTTYTVTATDAFGLTGTNTFNIKILAKIPAGLSYSSTSFYRGYRVAPITPTLTTSDGTLTYSVSPALPAGFTFNTSTGAISNSDYFTGAYAGPYVVTVTNSGGSTNFTLQNNFRNYYEKATNYFLWTGASGDGKWTTAGNWQKASGSASYPNASTHMVFFNGDCVNCNVSIDASVTVQGVFLAPDYTGTITQGASSVFTVGKNYGTGVPFCTNGGRYGEDWGWVQLGGTFVGSSANLIFSSIDQRGGTFTSTSGTLNLNLIGKTTVNYTPSRCRWDVNTNDYVGFQVATGATFNPASGSVAISASRYDSTSCGGTAFQISTPAAGINLNNLSISTYSDVTENPTGCSTLPSASVIGSSPQAVTLTTGARLNVAGDLTLKRGSLRWITSNYFGTGVFVSGNIVAECADAALIPSSVNYTTGDVNVPTNKQNCWQGGSVAIEANGVADQTYDVSGKVSNILLHVNKPAGSVLKPALGKEAQDARFSQIHIVSGTFRAPTSNLTLGVYSPASNNGFTPLMFATLTDQSADAVFDANSGTLIVQQNSVYDTGGGTFNPNIKTQWLGSEGANPLVLNNLVVDLSHKTPNSGNDLTLGNYASDSDVITVTGNLTILGGTLTKNKIYLGGNLTYGCSHGSYCSNVPMSSGAASLCWAVLGTELIFNGASDQYVSQTSASAIAHKGKWTLEKPAPYTSKLLLGSDLLLTGVAPYSSSNTTQRIHVSNGIFDLNNHNLSSNFSQLDSAAICTDGVSTASPIPADLRIRNAASADVLCNTSNPPDQVTNFGMSSNSGANKGVNPASCNQPEWF